MFQHAHEATTDDIVSSIFLFFHILPTVILRHLFYVMKICHVFSIFDAIFIQI